MFVFLESSQHFSTFLFFVVEISFFAMMLEKIAEMLRGVQNKQKTKVLRSGPWSGEV